MEPSTELKNIVLHYYEAVSQGNTALMEHLISRQDGTIVIGVGLSLC